MPLIFSMSFKIDNIYKLIIAFISFSFMSSVIYIINDIRDVENDKKHPRKCKRPIASGEVTKRKAIVIGIILLISAIITNSFASSNIINISLILLLIYFIINLIYSLGAKNLAIVDVFLLSAGFIIRIYYGASIIKVSVSKWLLLTILLFSLYLGLNKRKKELMYNGDVREVLKKYNESFLNNFGNISLTLFIVFYSFWALEQNSILIIFSIPLLLIIIMQYMLFMENCDEGDPMTILLQNKSLLLSVLVYVIYICTVMVVSYYEHI